MVIESAYSLFCYTVGLIGVTGLIFYCVIGIIWETATNMWWAASLMHWGYRVRKLEGVQLPATDWIGMYFKQVWLYFRYGRSVDISHRKSASHWRSPTDNRVAKELYTNLEN